MMACSLQLEEYMTIADNPFDTRFTVLHLNKVLSVHGLAKVHHQSKVITVIFPSPMCRCSCSRRFSVLFIYLSVCSWRWPTLWTTSIWWRRSGRRCWRWCRRCRSRVSTRCRTTWRRWDGRSAAFSPSLTSSPRRRLALSPTSTASGLAAKGGLRRPPPPARRRSWRPFRIRWGGRDRRRRRKGESWWKCLLQHPVLAKQPNVWKCFLCIYSTPIFERYLSFWNNKLVKSLNQAFTDQI